MKIAYHNRHRLAPLIEESCGGAVYCPTLASLLPSSDIITVHTPLDSSTTSFLSFAEFDLLKDSGAYIINTARGPIIDETALIAALESGRVLGVALDVFKDEPAGINPYFMKKDKCLLQPHLAGLTESSFRNAHREMLENVRAFLEKGKPNTPVNEPVAI